MAIHKIIYLPDPRLRKVSAPVDKIDDALQTLIDDMFETMYDARGVGLAAPQIGINIRLTVIDAGREKKEPLVFINPEIIESKDEELFEEGCLSVPGAGAGIVKRAKWIKVRALDRHGESFEMEADELLGECLQHEIDHLNGKLYVDLLSPLKKQRALEKLEKFKREQARQ